MAKLEARVYIGMSCTVCYRVGLVWTERNGESVTEWKFMIPVELTAKSKINDWASVNIFSYFWAQ